MREAVPHGRLELKIEEQRFKLADYRRFLSQEADSIASFRTTQRAAFAEERQRWVDSGQLNFSVEQAEVFDSQSGRAGWEGATVVESGVPGSIWKVLVTAGKRVAKGDVLAIVESMKMEIAIESPLDGVVVEVVAVEGKPIARASRWSSSGPELPRWGDGARAPRSHLAGFRADWPRRNARHAGC